ncbi:Thermonuclease precursor [Psychrobacter pasteurii]|uniref:Thermonuclease n=1 Tax=Psychrobacter pasteurii TaxID=1945520 RepID=A0A1R4EEG3_9GAMM|nr:thermonuclease family protein [Psychrobacter pasteurii]SJM36875.1 Thermonuclease precursor [Psychrobacter pasteurii]
MPFDLPKLKTPTLALIMAATLMVACEGNGDTPTSARSSSLTYNDSVSVDEFDANFDANYQSQLDSQDNTLDNPFSTPAGAALTAAEAVTANGSSAHTQTSTQTNNQPNTHTNSPTINTTASAGSECPITGNVIVAKSVRVIDGDTVEVIPTEGPSERIRLLGIDAPESNQAHGAYSTQVLQQCVSQGPVTVEWFEQDRYQRLLGKVRAGEVDCNLNQIKQGAAWHYKQYQNGQSERDRFTYANAEVNARQHALGLWANAIVTAPWDYRRGKQSSYQFDDTVYPVEGANCTMTGRRTTKHSSVSTAPVNNTTSQPNALLSAPVVLPDAASGTLDCGSMIKKTCSQMVSCEEAKMQLACGNTRLDGDKDGVPCESICPGG